MQELKRAHEALKAARDLLSEGRPSSPVSVAITNIDTSMLWLRFAIDVQTGIRTEQQDRVDTPPEG